MKKLISLMLALMLVFSMAISASATGEVPTDTTNTENSEPEKGSITINGVSEETTYDIYRLLDLESYDITSGAYSYKVNDAWGDFFTTGEGKDYVSIEEKSGYVTWTAGDSASTTAAFAKIALAYAKNNGIAPIKSSESNEMTVTGTTGKFSDLDLGWYLIDSSAGALCGLTTTNPDASINAKNGTPTIDKQVKEDSTDQWGGSNTADIGQIIEYRTTINVHPGPENFVLHDKMSAGLTFQNVTKIEHVVPGRSVNEVLEVDVDYTVNANPTEVHEDENGNEYTCSFEVVFDDDFINILDPNDKIIVHYQAMLNRNAVIAGDGNTNDSFLEYGDKHYTTHDNTITKTYAIDIIKTDSQNALLDGAKFRIYDAETGGNEVDVVLMDDGVTYRRARADEEGVEIEVKDGKVRVAGFDNGTYYLEETEAPKGYNKLTARQRFIISDSNLDSVFNGDIYSTGSGVHVVNKTGTMLPETGAMGTTMFLTFGSILVIACGVLLVTKKRMSMIED